MRGSTPVVGRELELGQLGGFLSEAEEGRGGILLVAGEAGVGKTRLVDAAIAAGDGLAPLRGVAVEHGGSPYAPIAAVLRQHHRRNRAGLPVAEPLAAHLAVVLPELGASPAVSERETVFEAVRDAFARLATTEPSVVVLDDLQWADSATLELLLPLAEAAEEWPLAIVGAYRNEEIPRGHPLRRLRTELRRAGRLTEIEVEPLDPASTAVLVERVLGAEPSPRLRAALYDRSQGVPFLVEELAEALREGGRIVAGRQGLELEGGSAVPIPETLRDALRLRVDGLSDEGRACLEAAAVIGLEVDLALLAELECDGGVGEAIDRGLLREIAPGVVGFRHDLVRETIHADTRWPKRRALHRQVAGALEARGAAPWPIADHWLAAGDRRRALPLLVEAARRSCALHAYRDAAELARMALEIWPETEDEAGRLAVLDELGRCALLCGETAEAGRIWEEVIAGLDGEDAERIAEVKRRLAAIHQLEGREERAAAMRLEVADAFEAAERHGEAAAELYNASELLWSDDARLEAVLRRGIDAARRAGDTEMESRCTTSLGFLTGRTGRRDEGLELLRTGLSLALDGNHTDAAVTAYWAIGASANDWADYPRAESAFDEMLHYCEANELPGEAHVCLGCLVVVLGNSGEWGRAEALALSLLEQERLPEISRIHALVTLGTIDAARGATKRARRRLLQARTLCGSGLSSSRYSCNAGLALADELEASETARWGELVSTDTGLLIAGYPRGVRLAATFAARRGDRELVLACADGAARWASRYPSDDALGALAHVLGELALLEEQPASAVDQLTRALDRLVEVDAPFERALTQVRLGTALVAAGEQEPGVEQLTGAYRTLRRLGARPFANRAAADLEAAGEPVSRRLGRRAARDLEQGGLTRRELEILRLVAVGRTNREIAHQLYLSPRTVDMHVRNVLAKLGCRTRTEASSRAHALGLLS